ncbi:MAG: hypothetical protein MASP_01473 [Candidatus Methanolliviera sp. GoM_asphalt]|nr:MAG: hypothetical protein MASP_01473 [Candidatus Methanolliviera sp. GoM_asphalt]
MANEPATIVQKTWNYCNVLRDDGVSYGDYVEQLTYLLFLKMADEQTKPPFNKPSNIPKDLDWQSLLELINQETWVGLDIDVKGEIYEELLQKNAEDTKSGAGQ